MITPVTTTGLQPGAIMVPLTLAHLNEAGNRRLAARVTEIAVTPTPTAVIDVASYRDQTWRI
jgi:hypothetical protein